MTNLELVVDYLCREYKSTARMCNDIDNGNSIIWHSNDKRELVKNTITRGYAVVMFAQGLDGVEYETIEPFYEQYKKNLEKLLTD